MLPSGPITVIAVCIAVMCSYIIEEVNIRLQRNIQCRAFIYAATAQIQCTNINQAWKTAGRVTVCTRRHAHNVNKENRWVLFVTYLCSY